MSVIKFAYDYPNERDKVFKTLETCQTIHQIEVAKNYFNALIQKWSNVMNSNKTIYLIVSADQDRFFDACLEKEKYLSF